jgi:hypothetical protein
MCPGIFVVNTLYNNSIHIFTEELDSQGLEPMFQLLRDIGMQVLPSLQNETTQEPFNWVPVAVWAKRLLFQDLLIGFSINPQNTNRTILRITLGTPDVRSPLPGYFTTYVHTLFNN